MRRKSIAYGLLIALAFTTTCCIGEHDSFWDGNSGELKVTAFYAPAAAYQTRSVADTTQIDTPADTIYIDDQTCMTTLVTDLVADTVLGTRGIPVDSPDQLTSLNLVMFNTKTAAYAEATSVATDLFTITATNGDFVLDKTYSWTAGIPDKHTFIAFAPKTGTSGITLAADKKSLTYAAPTTVADHPDLCLSDISKNSNIVNTVGSNSHNQRFALKHCLTAIGFEAVGYDLRITKVTLTGAFTTGVLNLTAGTWSSLNNALDCQPGIDTGRWLMCDDNTQMVNLTNINGYLMMIPQTLTDDMQLTMEYEGRNLQAGTGSYTVKLKDVAVEWTAGKKIIYQLRLKTKPAVENNVLAITDPRGGYTTPLPLNIAAAADDNLTFSWNEPWLRIHRGNPGYVNPAAGGAPSGWSTGVNNWSNLYFFTSADNPSTAAARTATVTVTGKKSGKRTFTVTQEKMVALAISPTAPGEVIPSSGKTYTIGVTSNTTWLGKEQTGATLSPASGNGNNGAVRVVVPKNSSWQDVPVKVVVSTTNTFGPVLTRTWTGTQPALPFSVLKNTSTIADVRGGYVATDKPSFDAAANDELTFTWNESWLKVYSGNRVNTVNTTTGSGSGFKANASQWNNLWFFATNEHRGVLDRKAVVTVKSKKGTTQTITVTQMATVFKKTNDSWIYLDNASGYTTVVDGFQAAPDDELTLSFRAWSSSTSIRFCLMDNPRTGVYVSSSLPSGSKIRGSDLRKLCIVSTGGSNEDVTLEITNSQNIKLTRLCYYTSPWMPYSNQNEIYFGAVTSAQTYVSVERRNLVYISEDSRDVIKDLGSISTSCELKSSSLSSKGWLDNDWISAKYIGARLSGGRIELEFDVTLKRNIYTQERTGNFNVTVHYKNLSRTMSIPVRQGASDAFYIFKGFYDDGRPVNDQPSLAIMDSRIGSFFFGENYRCVNHYGNGWATPNQDQLDMVTAMHQKQYLAVKVFGDDINGFWSYQTAPDGAFWVKMAYCFDETLGVGINNTYSRIRRGNRAYRCVKYI